MAMPKSLHPDLKSKIPYQFQLIECPICKGFGSIRGPYYEETLMYSTQLDEIPCQTCNEYGKILRIR